MIYSIILFVLFSFVSYRLIGVRSSLTRGLISSILSFVFSSVAFYAFHFRNEAGWGGITHFDHYTFLYFITLVIVSLGFSLILEMMKVQKRVNDLDKSVKVIDKIRYFIATRMRYVNLLFIISRNGLLRSTLQTDNKARNQQLSVAFKNTLEEAGGIFVKFGQFLSTRSDLFSKYFLEELSSLQESAYPVPIEEIKEVIETQFECPIKDVFLDFNEEPLAAASMAQVHQAKLHSGEEVVVKVLRPSLKKQLAIDINILANFSELLANRAVWAKRIGIVNLAEGFIQNLYEEVDFTVELENLKQMKKLQGTSVYIPEVLEEYSTPEVLVMEYLDGVSINGIDKIIKEDKERQEIVNTIFQEMLIQIFDRGVFHADPHPGNIFLLNSGQPAFIDFGSVGRLSTIQRNGFKWLLIGINRKNAASMVNGIKELVENSVEINAKALEQALSQFLVKHSFEGDIMDDMGKELFDIMGHFGLKFYPDVAGAFRSLITLQGSVQTIDPAFNLDQTIDIYLKDLMNIKSVTEFTLENVEEDLLNLIPKVRDFPKKIDNITEQVENGKLTFRMSLFADEDNVRYVNSIVSLFFTGLTGFALGILALGSLFLAQTEDPSGYSFLNVFGYSGLGLSVTMLIRVAIQSIRRRQ